MEFPISVITGETTTPILFGASFDRGSYDDDSSTLTLLHFPAESTSKTVFSFRLTEDMRGVDVLREELSVGSFIAVFVRFFFGAFLACLVFVFQNVSHFFLLFFGVPKKLVFFFL